MNRKQQMKNKQTAHELRVAVVNNVICPNCGKREQHYFAPLYSVEDVILKRPLEDCGYVHPWNVNYNLHR